MRGLAYWLNQKGSPFYVKSTFLTECIDQSFNFGREDEVKQRPSGGVSMSFCFSLCRPNKANYFSYLLNRSCSLFGSFDDSKGTQFCFVWLIPNDVVCS